MEDLAEYQDSEHAYMKVLDLTPADDETREAVVDGLAAAIYPALRLRRLEPFEAMRAV